MQEETLRTELGLNFVFTGKKIFDLSQLTFDIRLRESALWHIPCRAEGETERALAVNPAAFFNYFNVILTAHFKKKKKPEAINLSFV